MLSPLRRQKFEHLFKILDFDHNGLVEESDFISLGENISIFACINPGSATEVLIQQRGAQIWEALKQFTQNEQLNYCSLEMWLAFFDDFTNTIDPTSMDLMLHRFVNDIFSIYDKNKDDFISKQEFMCFFVSLRVEIKQVNACFVTLDLNGDMFLNHEELFKAFREFFLSEDEESPGNNLFGQTESFQFKTRSTVLSA